MTRLAQIRAALTRQGEHGAFDVAARLYLATWSVIFFALFAMTIGVMTGSIR